MFHVSGLTPQMGMDVTMSCCICSEHYPQHWGKVISHAGGAWNYVPSCFVKDREMCHTMCLRSPASVTEKLVECTSCGCKAERVMCWRYGC